jgi:hypothetical protein
MNHPEDLSPEQRIAVESQPGRTASEDEAVSIKALKPAAIVPSRLTEDERKAALEKLNIYFARVDAQRQPVSQEEEDAIVDEALRSTRSGAAIPAAAPSSARSG